MELIVPSTCDAVEVSRLPNPNQPRWRHPGIPSHLSLSCVPIGTRARREDPQADGRAITHRSSQPPGHGSEIVNVLRTRTASRASVDGHARDTQHDGGLAVVVRVARVGPPTATTR